MQPELFDEIENPSRPRRFQPPLFPHRFLRIRVAYEDLVFTVLGAFLILLAGFCLGVERGKKVAHMQPAQTTSAEPSNESIQLPQVSVPVQIQRQHERRAAHTEETRKQSTTESANDKYVIQLASYIDNQAAQSERQRLSRKGINAQVVKQGRYFELRAGGYKSRSEAQVSLDTLKKIYRDGFIKRLS